MRRIRIACRCAPIAFLAVVMGCAAGHVGGTTGRDLVGIDDRWSAAMARGDVEESMTFWTEGAVLYPPGRAPVYGKAAIRAFLESTQSQSDGALSWRPGCAGVAQCGTIAYTLGEASVALRNSDAPSGKSMSHYVAIWQFVNGRWLCSVQCWHTSAPAPGAG